MLNIFLIFECLTLINIAQSFKKCGAFTSLFHISRQHRTEEEFMHKQLSNTILHGHSRRDLFLVAGAGLAVPTTLFSPVQASSATIQGQDEQGNAIIDQKPKPLTDLPMIRLKLPKGALGREYIVIPFNVQNQGPFYFMVDSGLTTEMITPHLKDLLHIQTGSSTVRGIGAGGTKKIPLVELRDYSLWGRGVGDARFPLPPLHAIVTDFPQEHIDPKYDVEGMVGMEFLQMFDVDFDFPNGRIRFWPPQKADKEGLVSIPAAVLNESGLEGIRVISLQQKINQPMLGIIDSGASFSVVNLAAADLLGLSRDPKKYKSSFVQGIGIDGKPILMPTASVQFSFTGNAVKDPTSGAIRFQEPPENFKPWDDITVAVGDLPVFSDLLGDGKNPYNVPTVLIGLDILSQRRLLLESSGAGGRARRIFVAPS